MGMHKVRAVCSFVCSFVDDTRIRTSRIFLMGKFFFFVLTNIRVSGQNTTHLDYPKMDYAAEV